MFKRILAIAAMVCVLPMLANAQEGKLELWAKSAGGKITITNSSPVVVQTSAYGQSFKSYSTPSANAPSVTVAPNPGYQVTSGSNNCGGTIAVGAAPSTFTCANGQFVHATFLYNPLKINLTAAAGTGGKVNIKKIDNIFYGQKLLNPITFKFTPATGYKVSAITLTGGDIADLTVNPAIASAAVGQAVAVTFPTGYEMDADKALAATFVADMTVAPTAKIGAPQTITGTEATLASASIGAVSSWNWTQTAGPVDPATKLPVKAGFSAPAAASTKVTGLSVNGTYYFKLTINGGSTATTTIIKTDSVLASAKSQCVSCHVSNGVGVSPVNVYDNWSSGTHGTKATMCAVCHVGSNTAGHPGTTATNATCLSASCHGNPTLVKTITIAGKPDETVPLYVNQAVYATTIHGAQLCVSCHTDIVLANGGHANVAKMFGGWARFSQKQAVPFTPNTNNITAGNEDTRNYVTAASKSCSTAACHPSMSAFANSPHATIYKQLEASIDPQLTAYATACEGKPYNIGENWANGDCNRCHATCGTCHFKSAISRLNTTADTLKKFWDNLQGGVTTGWNANMTEFQMDWTQNVASHDFRSKAYFATDSEKVCEACHTGFNNPAQNAYYWKGEDRAFANSTTVGVVKATYVRRHPQATELVMSGYSSVSSLTFGKNKDHADMTCNDCHGTASNKSGNIHALPGQEYKWDADGDIHCSDCHNSYQHTDPWVAAHIAGGFEKGTKVACIGCHSFGLARDFELAKNGSSTSHDVFIDPVTKEVRPVVFKNGHAIAWYSHNWQTLDAGAGKLDPAGDCAKKCHYQGNLVGAGFEQGLTNAGKHGITANTCTSCHNGGGSDPIGDHVTVQNSAGHNVAAGSNECLLCHADFASWADTPHTQKAKIGSAYVYAGARAVMNWVPTESDPLRKDTVAGKSFREGYIHPKNREKNADGTDKVVNGRYVPIYTDILGVRAVLSETLVSGKPQFSTQTYGPDDVNIVIGSNYKQAYGVWMQGYGNKVLNIRYNSIYYDTDSDPATNSSMGDRWDERTWEGSCIGCHVTGYDKAAVPADYKDSATPYDLSGKMNDLRIGCVACHGSEVDATGHAKNVADLTQDQQIDICGRCHGNWNSTVAGTTARKDVTEFEAGDSLVYLLSPGYNGSVDRLKRPTWGTAIKEFSASGAATDDHEQWYDFKIGKHYGKSFNGKPVTCASCHDPHKRSTEAGRIYGRLILKGSYDLTNGTSTVCVGCHPTATFVVDGKTVTKKGKTGALNPHTGKAYGVGVEPTPAAGSKWPWEN